MTSAPDACDLLCLDLPHAETVRAVLPTAEDLTTAAAAAKALGDPTRLRVAAALSAGGAMCGGDLAWITQLAPNLVFHHLRQLRTAGLARSTRRGKLVMYELTDRGHAPLEVVAGFRRPSVQARQDGGAGDAGAVVPEQAPAGGAVSVAGGAAGQVL